jgi:hypothetical protein
MEKEVTPTREYLGILGFILVWFGLFLLLVAILFGQHIGLRLALLSSLGFWFLLILIFILIFLINITWLLFYRYYKKYHPWDRNDPKLLTRKG